MRILLARKDDLDAVSARVGDLENAPAPTASTVGLGNVDNTSDANKPVSTAQQTALDGKMATGYLVLPRTMSATVAVPTGSDIYLPEGVTITGQITLQGNARMVFVPNTGATRFG